MFAPDQYQLLDCGGGRKLERFGPWVLDRPAPQATGSRREPAAWRNCGARFEDSQLGQPGRWSGRWLDEGRPDTWQVSHPPLQFEARLAPTGQVGIFPEQAENWDWLRQAAGPPAPPRHVLNLFAYTGGSTLACALAGATVTHVDASRPVVAWARANAAASGVPADRIRWLVEDATRYVAREVRRGSRYDGLVLDPPSFGRGPRGERWKLADDLPALLAQCRELTGDGLQFILMTGHTTGWESRQIRELVGLALPRGEARRIEVGDLTLTSAAGVRLWSGWVARWMR